MSPSGDVAKWGRRQKVTLRVLTLLDISRRQSKLTLESNGVRVRGTLKVMNHLPALLTILPHTPLLAGVRSVGLAGARGCTGGVVDGTSGRGITGVEWVPVCT